MNNFTYTIPTKIHFGKNRLGKLAELKESGTKVLLVYGGGSIKKSGLYDAAVSVLKENGLEITELSGVEPNPRIESVRRGVSLCKENSIDMVLAIGGGSTIDCAKIVAAGAKYDGDPWDLVLRGSLIKEALPIYSVLTLSATGSEMDCFAVISDLEKNEKWGTGAEALKPKMSIMDPQYTYTVSKKQTSAGTADIMSHTFENYFTNVKGAGLQGHMCEAVLKTCIKYAPIALENPEDYDARANLMWCGSLAINGLLSYGAEVTWCVHPMEHELSAFYDITHGEGLAILTPVWMQYVIEKDPSKIPQIAEYGRNILDIRQEDDKKAAEEAVRKTADFFFETLNIPSTLREVGITEKNHFEVMAEKAAKGCAGSFMTLEKEDIIEIFNRAF